MTTANLPVVLQPPTRFELRRKLEEMVGHELLGPANGDYEEVNEPHIYERYLVGMLAPLNNSYEPPDANDELTSAEADDEQGGIEVANPFSKTIFPSSLGLTFCVDGAVSEIRLTARWGHYRKGKSETYLTKKGEPKSVWQRHPIKRQKTFKLKQGELRSWKVNEDFLVPPDFVVLVL